MKIRQLDPRIVDQIAAGEVVERPASVVKELVENALDAGSTRITVDLEEGGRALIRVVDDGHGIPPEELPLAFSSHATSKLSELGDLEHIATLGFRGEALASIGSISRASLRSRPSGSEAGAEISDHGGRIEGVRPAAAAPGTTIEIRDLFFNTPARRKFLKRDSTELGHCVEAVVRLALAHPSVEFRVRHDGRDVLHLPGDQDLPERTRSALGKALGADPLELSTRDGELGIVGVLQRPAEARRDARQYLFLNGRHIRDRALQRAIRDAYESFVFGAVQPSYVLHLSLDPSLADPNVHPTKIEVRFRDAGRIFGLLRRAVEGRLRVSGHATPGSEVAPARDVASFAPLPMPLAARAVAPVAASRPAAASGAEEPRLFPSYGAAPAPSEARAVPFVGDAEAPGAGEVASTALAAVLQVQDRYLVRSSAHGLEVIDQHALHERVNYEEFKRELRQRGIAIQALLEPEVRAVEPAVVAWVGENQELLLRLGLDLRPFGRGEVALFGLPARLANEDPSRLLERALEAFGDCEEGRALSEEMLLSEVLASRACRGAVMAGDPMRPDQVVWLLRAAARLENDTTCPHGRPTRIVFGIEDLDRAFKRR